MPIELKSVSKDINKKYRN